MSIFDNDIQEVLFSEEQLKNRVQEIARQITADYQGKEIMLISVLRGSFVFMADLCRAIDLPCTLDFMAVSSYGKGTKSSGQVQITKDLSEDITDRHIIVVEDILDSGNTLSYLLKLLEARGHHLVRNTVDQAMSTMLNSVMKVDGDYYAAGTGRVDGCGGALLPDGSAVLEGVSQEI